MRQFFVFFAVFLMSLFVVGCAASSGSSVFTSDRSASQRQNAEKADQQLSREADKIKD